MPASRVVMVTPTDWKLIALAAAAVGVLVLLITRLKVNPFISLLLASLVVGGGAAALGRTLRDAAGRESAYSMLSVVKSFTEGMGATLGSIAAIIGLGTMLGKLLAESGGAGVLAQRFASGFGPSRIHWCVVLLALVVGLATWFAVGLVLLLPILLTLAHETKQPFLKLALPLVSCLSVMHGLMPPHPGPVVAVEMLKVDMGLVLLWGFALGIPLALLGGPVLAWALAGRVEAAAPPVPISRETSGPVGQPPGFGLTLFSILLPVLLMLLATGADLTLPKGNTLREALAFIGNPTIALAFAVLVAMWSFGFRCGYTGTEVLKLTESCIGAVGMTILVVGGGGGFARVLRDSGVAESIGRLGEAAHLSPLLYGWLVAAFIRVATGSATVAITTASGLLAPVLVLHPELTQSHKALIVIALGAGSLFLSHLNDAGFWIVKDSFGFTVNQTFKTWSVSETVIGVAGLLLAMAAYALL